MSVVFSLVVHMSSFIQEAKKLNKKYQDTRQKMYSFF